MIPAPVIKLKVMKPALILTGAEGLHENVTGVGEVMRSTVQQISVGKAFKGQHAQVTVPVPNACLGVTSQQGSFGDV